MSQSLICFRVKIIEGWRNDTLAHATGDHAAEFDRADSPLVICRRFSAAS